jgi:hypothetical protein
MKWHRLPGLQLTEQDEELLLSLAGDVEKFMKPLVQDS